MKHLRFRVSLILFSCINKMKFIAASAFTLICVSSLCLPPAAQSADEQLQPKKEQWIELTLQSRDPNTGEISLKKEKINTANLGIVVVDMWNFHWCKTSTERIGSLVPRMAEVLEKAHAMGMTIFWCPSDVADNYAGTIQYQAAVAVHRHPLPPLAVVSCPPAPDGGGCTCGPERCSGNYGWDAMNPGLVMHDDDFMPNDLETLYSLCVERGITHLIYMGVHTQVCLLGKSIGLLNMKRAGFHCILARDLTDAHGRYDPKKGITPDHFTQNVVAHFEKYLAPTINFADELKKIGDWDDKIVDPVRIAPWGTLHRPHFFPTSIIVTLSAPWESNADFYFTLDGSSPTVKSQRYTGPFEVGETCVLRTIACQGTEQVCLPSEAYFVRLPAMPPSPEVRISELTPTRAVGPGHSPSSTDFRYTPGDNPPQKDHSNRMTPLKVRGKIYDDGVGVHAPNLLVYEVKPEYDRFVALAGDDEQVLAINSGSNLAMHPNVIFKVFIDGKLMAQSPIMRMSEGPWRFDVKLPENSKSISLVAADGGIGLGNSEDLADWVNAGFVLKK
jgi:hypothetical protein